jgi:hypothetical protein
MSSKPLRVRTLCASWKWLRSSTLVTPTWHFLADIHVDCLSSCVKLAAWLVTGRLTCLMSRQWYFSHLNPCVVVPTRDWMELCKKAFRGLGSLNWLASPLARVPFLWSGHALKSPTGQNLMCQLEVDNLGVRSSIILYILILYCINNNKQQATKAQPVSLSTLWIRFCTHHMSKIHITAIFWIQNASNSPFTVL